MNSGFGRGNASGKGKGGRAASGKRFARPRVSIENLWSSAAAHAVLIFVGGLWLLPTTGLFIQSLRTAAAINDSGWWTVFSNIRSLTLMPYKNLMLNPTMVRSIGNTFLITVPSTFLVVAVSTLAGYAFTCMRFPGRDAAFLVIVALLVVPVQVALIPVAQLYRLLGIFGSILGVVLFHVGFGLPFGVFLMRNMYTTIPSGLLEAARVDGAGHARTFFMISIPLVAPGIASLSIFQFVWTWNNLLVALVFAEPEAAPLTVAIQQQMRNFGTNVDIIAPGAFLQLLVPLLVFLAFQRYFIQGIMAGSVK
jgi:alpha-glucoside transport system permease protein